MSTELTPEQSAIQESAIAHAHKIKKKFAKEFTNKEKFPKEAAPVSVFMAGSPGAGKTEASKALIEQFKGDVIRIDADEFRHEFEGYSGDNSWLFQHAVSILVEKVHDLVIKNSQSFILDGTLTNHRKAALNIQRSIKRGRTIQLLYVYQEPVRAWEFVQAREKIEGRNIPLDRFIEQYFSARECVNKLKDEFDGDIKVDLLLQDRENVQRVYKANIDSIDNHVPEKYTPANLETLLSKD
ncbi:MAG: zeta toxin family protein [Colwellia sp.]